jgi:hypothetical protein
MGLRTRSVSELLVLIANAAGFEICAKCFIHIIVI